MATILMSQREVIEYIILGTLSSLSTADDMGRIFSGGTPQTSKMPSSIFL